MAVLKEYRCNDCKIIFDSTIPVCIYCGSENIQRIFVTPFGFKSDKTKSTDGHMEHHLKSFGLSDFSNNESTKHTPERRECWTSAKEALGMGGSDPKGSFLKTLDPVHSGTIERMKTGGGVDQRGPQEKK